MYIAPDTIIRILKDVPLDATYEHTLYWNTLASQRDYFIGKTKYLFQNQSYQRVNKGRLRIERKAEDLYDCNYLMFQNSAFGNKWFYAFITGVNYINNITSEIEYELDVMSTWFFDYELNPCFVEREHSVTDVVGDNLLPEPVALGDYVFSQQSRSEVFHDWVIVLASTAQAVGGIITDAPAQGIHFSHGFGDGNGTVQFLEYMVFDMTDEGMQAFVRAVNSIFTLILGGRDYVANVFLMPRAMTTIMDKTQEGGHLMFTSEAPYNTTKYGSSSSDPWYYVPRNKKLLTYPYNFLEVNNMQGSIAKFKFERFLENEASFIMTADYTANPNIVMFPVNYIYSGYNQDCAITVPTLPVVCFSATDLTAKMVQLSAFVASCAVGAGISMGVAGEAVGVASTESLAPNVANGLMKTDSIANVSSSRLAQQAFNASSKTVNIPLASREDANALKKVADVVGNSGGSLSEHTGQIGSANALQNAGMFDLFYTVKHITPEYARMIDDFFDRYGYATRRNKVPNRSSRPHWNYVKTATCTINGSIPSDDEKKITAIYNNGITFWNHGSEVGDYSLDNSPT